ncbi:hypothetical protein HY844_00430 [Candidatus Berkelbacteria bacterium]|nr:hypothetical protein [Candidatus Berkelbacteria bacterium]
MKQIAISAVTLGAFALLALSFYGYVLPPTMEAKQAQVASGNWQTFSEKLPSLLYWYTPTIQPEWKGWLALLVFGAFLVLLRSLKGNVWKCQFAVFVWAILQVGFYHFQAISYYGWYLVPITVAAYLCVGSLFETVLDYCLSEKFAKATFIALLCYGLYRATQWAYNNTVYILVNGELPTSTMSVSLILLGILVLVTLYAGRRHITSGLCWLRDIQNKKLIPFGVAVGAYCLFGLYPYLNTQTALLSKTIPSKDFMQVEAAKRYETVGRYIESNRIKDVAHVEIGIIGWFAPSTRIVDPLGLGSPVDLVSIKHSNYLRVLLEKKPSAIVDMDNSRKELYIAEKEDEKIILRNIRRWQKLVEGEYRSGIVLLPEPSLKASQRMVLKRFNTTVWVR